MSTDIHNQQDDVVDRAAAALRDMAVPPGPPEDLVLMTVAVLEQQARRPVAPASAAPIVPRHPTVLRLPRSLLRLAVAAMFVLAVGGALLWTAQRGGVAFADVLRNVRAVQYVRFVMVAEAHLPDARTQTTRAHVILSDGGVMRQDQISAGGEPTVSIVNLREKQALTLLPNRKQAVQVTMKDLPPGNEQVNILDQLRGVDEKNARAVGRMQVDGRYAQGFEVARRDTTMTLWADEQTRLPVRIELRARGGMTMDLAITMSDFDWSPKVDPALLTLTPPPDYEVVSTTMDMSEPTERDLIEALRQCAQMNEGRFPTGFGLQTVYELGLKVAGRSVVRIAEGDLKFQTEIMQKMLPIVRGFMFVNEANGEDYHYAGDGVQLGEPGRIIFWYRPRGSASLRVIDASLNVAELPAAQQPLAANAVRIKPAGRQ